MSHLDYDPLTINGLYERGSYLQAIQHLQDEIPKQTLNDVCCTSKPIKHYTTNDIHYLSDIIKIFGDLGIRTLQEEHQYGSVPILTIEADMYAQRTEKTVSDVINNMTDNQQKVLNYILDETLKLKENNEMNNNMSNNSMFDSFKGMFGKVDNGMCRLSMNGHIAVKTSNGYKSYNMKEGRLVNCANFVFPMGDEMFFIIPTNKVEAGDIIIVAGLPKCVLKKDAGTITVINYEDSTVETILPERHIFMGEAYFYGKIVSMFGNDILEGKGDKGMKKIMTYMMMSEMMKGGTGKGDMSSMLPFMLMSGNGGFGDIFSGLFDFDDADDCSDIEDGAEK